RDRVELGRMLVEILEHPFHALVIGEQHLSDGHGHRSTRSEYPRSKRSWTASVASRFPVTPESFSRWAYRSRDDGGAGVSCTCRCYNNSMLRRSRLLRG